MIRTLSLILACICIAVVFTEVAALAVFYKQGWLAPHYWREVRLVCENRQIEASVPEAPQDSATVSRDDVLKERALKLLDLEQREGDLKVLRQNIITRADELARDEAALKARRVAFEKELGKLREEAASAATEQARGVLLALPPAEAALKLTQIPEAEAIRLLKGVPEKSIAKILKEFTGSPEQIERSKRLFEALVKGDPEVSRIDAAGNAPADSTPADPAPTAPPM